jgi:hypothetical protein
MKKRPKPCIKTLAILGCVVAVILSASAVVADVVMTRLMHAVRDTPEAAAPPEPAAATPP